MASIERIEVCTTAIPLATPIAFATAGVAARCFALLRVRDADGASGIAYGYVGSRPTTLVTRAVRELLGPILRAADAQDIAGLWERMYSGTLLHGRAGSVMRAIALVDTALHDLSARKAGVPLYRHLGGEPRETVAAYAAGGYYTPGKEEHGLAREMAGLVALGFRAVKMKTGKFAPNVEARRVAAVRGAIGSAVHLLLDANNSWPDVESALVSLRLLEPYQPFWIEEPFAPDDIDSHAALAKLCRVPVALGENEATRWRFKEMLDKKAAGYLQPDATACGGVTEWMRIAKLANQAGVPICPHAYHDVHVHLLAAAGGNGVIEFMPGDDIMNFGRLIDRQLEHRDGAVLLPQSPGLGFDFVEPAVEKHAVREHGEASAWARAL